MSIKLPSDVRPLAKKARKAGWSLLRTPKNHLQWVDPTGRVQVTSSGTPTDSHAVKNLRGDLRRAGLAL